MNRLLRLAAVAALAASAFATTTASAAPGCTVELVTQRFAGPGGGTWTITYPVVTCTEQ
ncbi:MAG TPA: hypothetical protein VGX28_13345 [Frankiaceae bacterium]|jgi:hypothetical protein|nr:hypothetical protein [Frankiaceae bacterium]